MCVKIICLIINSQNCLITILKFLGIKHYDITLINKELKKQNYKSWKYKSILKTNKNINITLI